MGAADISQEQGGSQIPGAPEQPYAVLDPTVAIKAFGIGVPGDIKLTEDFPPNARLLGQIYDTIQRHLTGAQRRTDSFFPSPEDVYADLQLHRRSVSDKSALPPPEELELMTMTLAVQPVPFIHFVREFVKDANPLGYKVVTRYAAPTEKHPDKITVAYRSIIRNSGNVLREIAFRKTFKDWGERLAHVKRLEDLNLTEDRVPHLLSALYLPDPRRDAMWSTRCRRVNESILKNVYKPLLDALVKDGVAFILSCSDIRGTHAWAAKLPDICLFRNLEQLDNRFQRLSEFLDSSVCREVMDPGLVHNVEQGKGTAFPPEQYPMRLAEAILTRYRDKPDAPLALLHLAVEVSKLGNWLTTQKKEIQQKEERQELTDILEKIRKHGDVFRVKSAHKYTIPQQYILPFLLGKVPQILAVSDPYDVFRASGNPDLNAYDNFYLLFKDRAITGNAVDKAVGLFERNGDVFLLRVVENLIGLDRVSDVEIKHYLAPVHIQRLREAIIKSYVLQLPWWSRLWLFLTTSEVTERHVRAVRNRILAENDGRVARIRHGQQARKFESARQEVKALAQKRMTEGGSRRDDDLDVHPIRSTEKLAAAEQALYAKFQDFLEGVWARGNFPTADDLYLTAGDEGKDLAKKILGLVDVGAASVKGIVALPLSSGGRIYGPSQYLASNKENLLERCSRALSPGDNIVLDDKVMMLKKDNRNREAYEALARYLRGIT